MSTCNFHPHEQAVTTCERCNRRICLHDKRIHRKTVGSGEDRYSVRYEYCPLCKSDVEISDATGSIVGGIAMIIFALFFVSMASSIDAPGIFSFVGILFIIFGVGSILTAPTKKENARKRQTAFLNSLKESPKGVKQNNDAKSKLYQYSHIKSSWSSIKLNCFACGNRISMTDKYCLNCGDSTKEEIEAARSR